MTTKNKKARIGVRSTAAGKPVYAFRQDSTTAVVCLILPQGSDFCTTAPHRGQNAKH